MKVLFIINPVAGGGKAKNAWKAYGKDILSEFPDSETIFTSFPGEATSIASEAISKGYEAVVSCGGDGTLNEVINGIVGSNILLGVFPLGTGSDFGRTIGITDYESFISSMKRGRRISIDLGKVEFPNGKIRYFINSLEVGFGADVMNFVDKHIRIGRLTFLTGVVASLLRLRMFDAELEVDKNFGNYRTIEIIIANGKYFGGGMLASPNSKIDDSILDLHILKPIGRLGTLIRLRELIKGSYIEKGFSIELAGKEIEIKSQNVLAEMDGEVIGHPPLKVSLVPSALTLLVP